MKGKIEVAELFMFQFQDQPRTDHHFQEEKPEQEQEGQGNNTQDPEPFTEKGGDSHIDDTVPSQEPYFRPSLGEFSAVDEENDGFRTPTSTAHKIPAITECPPAPRKPTVTRAIPMKRRTISKVSRRLQFDHEFEQVLNIPPKILASFLSRFMKPSKDERK